jgi:predicted permease
MDGFDNNDAVFVEDAPTPEGQIPPVRRIKAILPGYFGTMGNPVLAGRDLEWPDIHEGRPVVVVTENLAREYWQTPGAAIGRRIARYTQDGSISWSEIVGVVGNIRDDGMDQDPVATTFWPQLTHMPAPGNPAVMEPSAQRSMAFVVRAPEAVLATILPRLQESVWSVSASVPLASVATQSERIRRSVARTSFTLVLLAIAGGVGLLLGAVGLYGVISYSVSQRRREIGVRMALGAAGGEVAGMVLRQGMLLAGMGILTGLIAAAGATRLMSSLLYGVAPVDVPTFAVVPVILLAVAAFASWLPARRAAAVNPSVTLREE